MYIALNQAYSILAGSLTNVATSLSVQTGHGSRFAVGTYYSYITLEDSSGNIEICKLTAQSGDTLTIVRGQDGTTGLAWNIGDIVECRPCKAAITDIKADAVTEANAATLTHAATSKTTPVDADEIPLADSAAIFVLKKLTWANLKATLGSTFAALAGSVSQAFAAASIELGHASDTTLTRVSAGVAAVEGATIVTTAPSTSGNVLTSNGTIWTSATPTGAAQIQPISASVGSSALTISASALSLAFRSATLTSGTVTTVSGTPSNLVISSGSTLGTINATQSRIAVIALNNAGTIELAAVNISGGNDLSETGVISTTAEGGAGAADTANVIYSTTARSNLAYRVIGYIESTQATAGTWDTAPSTIQGCGGQALTSLQSFGYGQTWQSVTRTTAVTYYNTTGKPIFLSAQFTLGGALSQITVNSVLVTTSNTGSSGNQSIQAVIPVNASYFVTDGGGSRTGTVELR